MFAPTKVLDIELSEPILEIKGQDGYAALQVLVRLHGVPLGYVDLPAHLSGHEISYIKAAILEKNSHGLLRQLLSDALATTGACGFGPALVNTGLHHSAGTLPSLTVVVCSRDRTDELATCLDGLSHLDYPNLEIVVVDNAPSTDATERLVRASHPAVRYVREPRPGLDWARNRGIAEAQGDIVAFTDDDVVVDPMWAMALARVFAENPEVMAVTGLVAPFELETEAQVLFERYGGFGRGFERKWFRLASGKNRLAAPECAGAGKYGTGANMAYRRCVFDAIGTFDPALDVGTPTNGGGDLEMFFRVLKEGYTLVYEPRAIVRHRHRRDYARLLVQIRNNGIGFYSHLVRSALAYPEERAALARFGLWWFWFWSVRRLIASVLGRYDFPRDLILAELFGSLRGLRRYGVSTRAIGGLKLRGADGRHAKVGTQMQDFKPPSSIAIRVVDIDAPLHPLTDVTGYHMTRIVVQMHGRLIGKIDITNDFQPIGVGRLCDAIATELFPQIQKAILRAYFRFDEGTDAAAEPGLPETVPVSVVVATFDRPAQLRTCLKSLLSQQSRRPLEIIVVDNNPGSRLTPAVTADFPGVIVIPEDRAGLSYARNKGITRSTGEIIVFTDDDVTMPPDWLEKLLAPFARRDVMVVTGNILPLKLETRAQCLFEAYGGLGRGFEPKVVDLNWFNQFRGAVPTWELGATANAAFRATIFNHPEIGLLDEALGAGTPTGCSEDTYLFYRTLKAGFAIAYHPDAYVWHLHREDESQLKRQVYNYSKGHVAYHLTTWLHDHDWRALWRLFISLPLSFLRRTKARILGRSDYPGSLIFVEIAGSLAGPLALLRSRLRVRQKGRSEPYHAAYLRVPDQSLSPSSLSQSSGSAGTEPPLT